MNETVADRRIPESSGGLRPAGHSLLTEKSQRCYRKGLDDLNTNSIRERPGLFISSITVERKLYILLDWYRARSPKLSHFRRLSVSPPSPAPLSSVTSAAKARPLNQPPPLSPGTGTTQSSPRTLFAVILRQRQQPGINQGLNRPEQCPLSSKKDFRTGQYPPPNENLAGPAINQDYYTLYTIFTYYVVNYTFVDGINYKNF